MVNHAQLISRRAILPHPAIVSAMCSQNPACTTSSHTRSNAAIFFFFFSFTFAPVDPTLTLVRAFYRSQSQLGICSRPARRRLGICCDSFTSRAVRVSVSQSIIDPVSTIWELEQNRQKGVRRASTIDFSISRAIPESSDQLSERLPRWM